MFLVPREGVRPPAGRAHVDGWDDLETREQALGIRRGQWFLLEDGEPGDPDLLAFFGPGSPLTRKAEGTRRSYARDLKVHFEFLARNGKSWRDATPDDFADYEFWRRRDPDNPGRVAGSKFNREVAACRLFYEWQVRVRQTLTTSPVKVGEVRRRDGSVAQTADLRSRDVRANRVNWLTPRAYRRWRDVGLDGYRGDGLREPGWRGRNDVRNLAFADLLWTTGLRLREAGTLLTLELPRARSGVDFPKGRVADAVAKGAGRSFWISSVTLARVATYLNSTRSEAISRARALGRYDRMRGIRQVRDFSFDRRDVTYVDEDGVLGQVQLDALDENERTRLFVTGPGGLEPAWLWLGESGLPMLPASWEVVFDRANDRCERYGLPDLFCRPHMLRHSFALLMLIGIQYRHDRRFGLTPEERQEHRELFGDPFWLVKELLGHRRIETTRDTYLAPMAEIQVDELLNDSADQFEFITTILARIAASDPRVIDVDADQQ